MCSLQLKGMVVLVIMINYMAGSINFRRGLMQCCRLSSFAPFYDGIFGMLSASGEWFVSLSSFIY